MPKHSVPLWHIAAFSLALALPGLLAITPGDPIAGAGISSSHGPAPVHPNPHRLGQAERTTIYLPALELSPGPLVLEEVKRIKGLADGWSSAIAAQGSQAYLVQRRSQFAVFDVSVLNQPRLLGSVELPFESRAQQIVPAGDRIHVVLSSFGLSACPNVDPAYYNYCSVVVDVDVRDPSQPKVVGYVRVSGMSQTIALAGDKLYLFTARETPASSLSIAMLRIIDVKTPGVPREVAATELPYDIDKAIVLDKRMLAVGEGLLRYDISDPERPKLLEQSGGIGQAVLAARLNRDVIVVAERGKIRILHWRNGISLERFTDLQLSFEPIMDQFDLQFAHFNEAAMLDQRLVVFDRPGVCSLRMSACQNSRILAVYDLAGAPAFLGAIQVNRIGELEYTRPQSFRFTALPGHVLISGGSHGGFSVVDAASPAAPRELERREILGRPSALAIRGDHLYVGDDDPEVWVWDVAQPDDPQPLGVTTVSANIEPPLAVGDGWVFAHTSAGPDDHRLEAVDVRDPSRPVALPPLQLTAPKVRMAADGSRLYTFGGGQIGIFSAQDGMLTSPSAITTSLSVEDLAGVSGRLLVLGAGEAGIVILDVSDPATPRELARLTLPHAVCRLAIRHPYVYAQSCGGIGSTVYTIDVTDPAAPAPVSTLELAVATVDGFQIAGDQMFGIGWRSGAMKLIAIDLSTPETPRWRGEGSASPLAVCCASFSRAVAYAVAGDAEHIVSAHDGLTISQLKR